MPPTIWVHATRQALVLTQTSAKPISKSSDTRARLAYQTQDNVAATCPAFLQTLRDVVSPLPVPDSQSNAASLPQLVPAKKNRVNNWSLGSAHRLTLALRSSLQLRPGIFVPQIGSGQLACTNSANSALATTLLKVSFLRVRITGIAPTKY